MGPVAGVPVHAGLPAVPAIETEKAVEAKQKLDLVFVMDCTGSMGSYIQAAKQNIQNIVGRLSSQEGYDLRFGLVAYRDHPPQDQTFVSKAFPFCVALQQMQANLRTLSANGGGDGPEAVEAGLQAALELDWRDTATKVVVLIADAPPHGLGESGDGFPNGAPTGVDPLQVLDTMSMRGITVYSVGCQPALGHYQFATDFMIAVAERTNGQAVALGSAAALADVILGASIEEADLEVLSREVEQQVKTLQRERPDLDEEHQMELVYRSLQSKGRKTRQMKSTKLTSAHVDLVSKAATLSEARESLEKAAPVCRSVSPPLEALRKAEGGSMLPRSLARKKKSLSSLKAYHPSEASPGTLRSLSSASALSFYDTTGAVETVEDTLEIEEALHDAVETVEDTVSYEQVTRMYGKAKKSGRW